MINHRTAIHLVLIIIAGSVLQTSGFTNPFNPLLPVPARLRLLKPTPDQPAQQAQTSRLAKRAAPGTGVIAGRVVDLNATLYSTKPTVSVIDSFGWEVANMSCGDSGYYRAAGLYPGAYLVSAYTDYTARYYNTSTGITYLGNTNTLDAAKWIRLAAGQSLTGQDITIATQTQQQKIELSGICFAGPGTATPLSGISLNFYFVSADNSSGWAANTVSKYCYTGTGGVFACTLSMAPGNYYGLVRPSGTYAPQWWDGGPISAEPRAASISTSVTGKEIHLETSGSISGVIKDAMSDSLLSWMDVYAIDKDGYSINYDYCYGKDTTFIISGLPEGSYFIKAAYSSGPYATSYYPQTGSIDSAVSVAVTAGKTTQGVRIMLLRNKDHAATSEKKGQIKGRVTRQDNGAAIPKVSVGFGLGSDMFFSSTSTTTDTLGYYSDSLTADSAYYVFAGRYMGYSYGVSSDYYLAQTWHPGVIDQASASTVKVVQGTPITVDIAVQHGGGIAGWVRTAGNAGLPGYLKAIYGAGDLVYAYAWTDDFKNICISYIGELSGFRFVGVPPGTYSIRFLSYNYNINAGGYGETEHGYATARGVTVIKENTAFNQTLTMPDANARITGILGSDPQKGDIGIYSYLYCYSADSIIAGISISYLTAAGYTRSAKGNFYSTDFPASSTQTPPTQLNYSIGKLPPGKYAVARFAVDTAAKAYSRQWYGTNTWQPVATIPYKEYLREFLKPNIPATSWITLGVNETKSGINFGNVGAINPLNSNQAMNAELRLLQGPSQKVALRYRLPRLDKNNRGVLSIYRLDGSRIKTISLEKPEGVVAWDGMNDSHSPVSAGVYVYRLSGAGKMVTVKGAWVR
jgi:hypothetical protein